LVVEAIASQASASFRIWFAWGRPPPAVQAEQSSAEVCLSSARS
jgi:hypothetical protein